LGFDGVVLDVEVVLVLVLVVVVLGGGWVCVEEVVLVVPVLTGAGDVEVVEVAGGGHDSETLLAGPGRFSEDSGAPGASWK
jgi:hypothetical protein